MKTLNLLPLGSIVTLISGGKKLIIYGRVQLAVESKEEFDYLACLWPEGNIDVEFTYLFNHTDIDEIIYRGYTDSEDLTFLAYMSDQ
jgi:hypothetical protein